MASLRPQSRRRASARKTTRDPLKTLPGVACQTPCELPLLGSNQDSPDPESGVLPVTPRGSGVFFSRRGRPKARDPQPSDYSSETPVVQPRGTPLVPRFPRGNPIIHHYLRDSRAPLSTRVRRALHPTVAAALLAGFSS